jgi:hypothetical protein
MNRTSGKQKRNFTRGNTILFRKALHVVRNKAFRKQDRRRYSDFIERNRLKSGELAQ